MPINNLRTALTTAGLTADEFADIVRVDPKTVGRWLAGHSTPYPRHRITISRALDLPEHQLWPELTDPAAAPQTASGSADTDSFSEMIRTWAFLDDSDAPNPIALLHECEGPVDVLDNTRGIELGAPLIDALTQHADKGHEVRVLTAYPHRRQTPLVQHENIELRVLDGWVTYGILRAGDTALFTVNFQGIDNDPPILLHVDRDTGGGLSDRLTEIFQDHWDNAEDTIETLQQLESYRTNADDDQEAEEEYEREIQQERERPDDTAGTELDRWQSITPMASESVSEPPRRWPGRTD